MASGEALTTAVAFPGIQRISMRSLFGVDHSLPVFEGRESRRHEDMPLWRLYLQAHRHWVKARPVVRTAERFVQFVGFPRSGHTLVGSILDAHPRALISHELDALGLLGKGLSPRLVFSLIHRNSAEFAEQGRNWNGFSYLISGQYNGQGRRLKVIGDKKGDWAVRWFLQDRSLLERTANQVQQRCQWLLVVRHPLDNIATMSLRKGGHYDRLRIAASDPSQFREGLARRQGIDVAAKATDAIIDDYALLCAGIEEMKARIAPEDWYEVHYERFIDAPAGGIRDLLGFVGLAADSRFVSDCAALMHKSVNKSRNAVSWDQGQQARVDEMIQSFSFLRRFQDEF